MEGAREVVVRTREGSGGLPAVPDQDGETE